MCVDSVIRTDAERGGTQGGVQRYEGRRMSDVVKRKVTSRQAALVDTLVAKGCSITEAAAEAGYASGESGRVTASKALRLPHVQQYMIERVGEALGLNATVAAAKLLHLAKGAKSEYVQLEASKDILDRAGFKPPDRHMHLHAGDISVSIDLT